VSAVEPDDLTHYMEACSRLRAERDSLAEALREIAKTAPPDSLIAAMARHALRDEDPEAGSESSEQQSVEGQ
jgi:hypothetical protein